MGQGGSVHKQRIQATSGQVVKGGSAINGIDAVKAVLSTLNTVEVKGKDNMDKMLGCMQVLEKLEEAFEEMQGKEPEHDADNQYGENVHGQMG